MVLDRRMFRRPSQMAPRRGPSSKGVGITSGLTQPVQKFSTGDFAQTVRQTREDILPALQEFIPEQTFYDRAGMSPFRFFAALGSPMGPGQTVLGKIGEAGQFLDIKPEGDPAGDLATDLALQVGLKSLEKEKEDTFIEVFAKSEDKDKGITKGQKIRINADDYDPSIYDLADPTKEETFIDVYAKVADKDKGINLGQKIRIDTTEYDPNIHDLAAPKEEEDKDKRTDITYDFRDLKNGLTQRTVTYYDTVKNDFVTEDVGDPYYKKPEDKINDSVADVDAYIESLEGQINPATNLVWTQAELDTERSVRLGEALSKQKLFPTVDEEAELLRRKVATENDGEIAKGIIQNIQDNSKVINQQLTNVATAKTAVETATTGSYVNMRNAFGMIMDSFPALAALVPEEIQGNIAEALNTGDLSATELLDAILTQGVLDRAASGSLKGNYNQKEIDLFIDSGAKVLQTKEGIDLLLDLQQRQLEILQNSQLLYNEFLRNGTVNGEKVKDSIDAAFKIKAAETELFREYANSDEIQNRVQEALGYGDYRGSDFFLNAEPLVISGQKFEIKDLYQDGRINVVGYANDNGEIVLPNGAIYRDPLITPKQPVYQIRISDKPDKNGKYDFIFVTGDQFSKR